MKGIVGFAVKSALVGIVLVMLSGIIGRVDLGTIVFRMFVGAVLLAALGAAAFFVIQKYIPELLTELKINTVNDDLLGSDIVGDHAAEDKKSGKRVDIVIDGESADQAEALRREAKQQSENSQSGMMEPDGTKRLAGHDVGTSGDVLTEEKNGIVEEVHADSDNLSDDASASLEDDGFNSGVENFPDISDFSDAFHDENGSSEGEDAVEADSEIKFAFSGPGESTTSADGMNMDSKIYAEAIRTTLKKG